MSRLAENRGMPFPPEILHEMEVYLDREDSVTAAFVFGSFAHGRQRAASDVDIALLLDEREQRQDRKKLTDRVIATLGRILRKDVHLLILNDASYLARVQALFRGRPVFVRNPEALARFRMVSMTLHADYTPLLRRMQKKLAEKLCRSSGAP